MQLMLIIGMALLLTGCDRREANLRKQVTGTWTHDGQFELSLLADGSFVSHLGNSNKSWTYQGTWKIEDGGIVSTLTNCIAEGTTNFERVGSVDHSTIIQADLTDLVYSNSGQIISLRRK